MHEDVKHIESSDDAEKRPWRTIFAFVLVIPKCHNTHSFEVFAVKK